MLNSALILGIAVALTQEAKTITSAEKIAFIGTVAQTAPEVRVLHRRCDPKGRAVHARAVSANQARYQER